MPFSITGISQFYLHFLQCQNFASVKQSFHTAEQLSVSFTCFTAITLHVNSLIQMQVVFEPMKCLPVYVEHCNFSLDLVMQSSLSAEQLSVSFTAFTSITLHVNSVIQLQSMPSNICDTAEPHFQYGHP